MSTATADDERPWVWHEGAGTSDRRWLHADARGSIVAVSNGAGTAIAVNAYDEYGIPKGSNSGRFQYTGQTWLPELGMYNTRRGSTRRRSAASCRLTLSAMADWLMNMYA
jgi:hypothetical protein